MSKGKTYSEISTVEGSRIHLRGRDLVDEVMGKASFTEVIFLTILGRMPEASEQRVLDTVLVALVDHGVTGSTLAARLTYQSAPEAMQGAVAAGLLNAGGRVLGSMEGCGRVLSEWAPDEPGEEAVAEAARLAVEDHKARGGRIPGLGHRMHEAGDLRASRLIEVAGEEGYRGGYVLLLEALEAEASRAAGKHVPINVTGAIAAVLLELGVDWQVLRGFALISRVVGLVAHIGDEQRTGVVNDLLRSLQRGELWDALERPPSS